MMLRRKSSSKKGDNGRILVIGGSKDYPGAAYLAAGAIAALRSGTDIATVAAPDKVAWAINALNPDIITRKIKGGYLELRHFEQLQKLIQKSDVFLIGNGIGLRKKTMELVRQLVKKNSSKPKVIDADAIKAIRIQDTDNAIFTPHQKEFDILLDNSNLDTGNFRQHLKNNVILLKGQADKIISKTKLRLNKTGNPGMTVAGTGDVLAGLCAGLAAPGMGLFTAASRAAEICGCIGDALEKELGYGFIASDFLREIAKKTKILYKTTGRK